MKGLMLLLTLGLLATPSPLSSEQLYDTVIVPGQRIWKWTLDLPLDELMKMNGDGFAFVAGDEDMHGEIHARFWVGLRVPVGAAHRPRQQRIEFLWALSPDIKTTEGISIVSSKNRVLAAYGSPTAETRASTQESSWATRLIYDERGIAFRVNASDRVGAIYVFRPGTAKTIWKF